MDIDIDGIPSTHVYWKQEGCIYERLGVSTFREAVEFHDVLENGDRLTFTASDRLEGTFFDETQAPGWVERDERALVPWHVRLRDHGRRVVDELAVSVGPVAESRCSPAAIAFRMSTKSSFVPDCPTLPNSLYLLRNIRRKSIFL